MKGFFSWFRRRQKTVRRSSPLRGWELLESRDLLSTTMPQLAAGNDSGLSATDLITRNTLPVFQGTTTSPAGSTIALLIDGQQVDFQTITAPGNFSFTVRTPLTSGTYSIQFQDST